MNLIVVVDNHWGIGKNNNLLFSLKKDMQFFKQTTLGKTVVMGANTFASLPCGALPQRNNIVLDSSGANHSGTTTVQTLQQLLQLLQTLPQEEVFVIGGASVYKLLLPLCSKAYVTKVNSDGHADVFFPNLDQTEGWRCTWQSPPQQDGDHTIVFCTYCNETVG